MRGITNKNVDRIHLSLTRLLVNVKPMKGRSFPENSVLRLYWSNDGAGCAFSNSSKLDVSSLLVMVGMNGGVAENCHSTEL